MGDHNHAARPVLQGSNQPRERGFVQVVGGFVEQQELWLFQEDMAKVQSCSLTAAQGRHGGLPAGLRILRLANVSSSRLSMV